MDAYERDREHNAIGERCEQCGDYPCTCGVELDAEDDAEEVEG